MNVILYLRKVIIFLFVTCSFNACKSQFISEFEGQQNGKNARIHLLVDAQKLFDKATLDLEYCALWDNKPENVQKGGGVKDFTSTVYDKNLVSWKATVDYDSEEKGYSVKILQIEMQENNCVFDKTVLAGKSGMVVAKVNRKNIDLCKSSYSIWFELEAPNGKTRVFKLDPFLRAVK